MAFEIGAALGAASLVPTLFGSGGSVSVPGSMAKPTDPTAKFVDESGVLRDQFRTAGLTNESLEQGKGILGGLAQRGQAQGPSQAAQYLQGANQAEIQGQRDQLDNQQASNLATSQANLAMKGGRGSGSAERLASAGNLQNMLQNQTLNRQAGQNNLNILANDESQKLGILKNLPGQFQSFGNEQMGRQVGDTQGGMNLLTNKYDRDMQAFGANQMARAQAKAQNASSKGLLGGLF